MSNLIQIYFCCAAKSPQAPVQCGTSTSFARHYGCICENLKCNVTTTTTSSSSQRQWCKINDGDAMVPRGCLLTTTKISSEFTAQAYPGFFNETDVSKGLSLFISSSSTCNDMCPSTTVRTPLPPTTMTESLVPQSSTTTTATTVTFQPTPLPTPQSTTPFPTPVATPMPVQPTLFPTPYPMPSPSTTSTSTSPIDCSRFTNCEKCLEASSVCEWCQPSTVDYCRKPVVEVCDNDYPDAVRVCSLTKQSKSQITESTKSTSTTMLETLLTSVDISLETTSETDDIISVVPLSSSANNLENIFNTYFWLIIGGIILTVVLAVGIGLCIAFRKSIHISYCRVIRQQYLCSQCYSVVPRVVFTSKVSLDEHQSQQHSLHNRATLQPIDNGLHANQQFQSFRVDAANDQSRYSSMPRTSTTATPHIYHAPPHVGQINNSHNGNSIDAYTGLPLFQKDRYQSSFNQI